MAYKMRILVFPIALAWATCSVAHFKMPRFNPQSLVSAGSLLAALLAHLSEILLVMPL